MIDPPSFFKSLLEAESIRNTFPFRKLHLQQIYSTGRTVNASGSRVDINGEYEVFELFKSMWERLLLL